MSNGKLPQALEGQFVDLTAIGDVAIALERYMCDYNRQAAEAALLACGLDAAQVGQMLDVAEKGGDTEV